MSKPKEVPRIPVIYVTGNDELPICVREQMLAVTPSCVPILKPVGTIVDFCRDGITPDLVIITNLQIVGVKTAEIIQGLITLGVRVAVMVSHLTEPSLQQFGQDITLIRKPANLRPLLQGVIKALTRPKVA